MRSRGDGAALCGAVRVAAHARWVSWARHGAAGCVAGRCGRQQAEALRAEACVNAWQCKGALAAVLAMRLEAESSSEVIFKRV